MRKTISKNYPVFEHQELYNHASSSEPTWLNKEVFSENFKIPKRFQNLYRKADLGKLEENFIIFGGKVNVGDGSQITQIVAPFKYEEPVILTNNKQLRGDLPDGDVDFNIEWKYISMENGHSVKDPNTGVGVRYPFTVATYFPIRNILIIRDITFGEPTESLMRLLTWILEKIETVGYKYTETGPILIGCDPEFNVLDIMGERISAETLFPDPHDSLPIGTDTHSSTGELRPDPEECPLKLTENIKRLMEEAARKVNNNTKIVTGGGKGIAPTGHHIHFSHMICKEEKELLDDLVGGPSLQIEGADRGDSRYGRIGRDDVRQQPHGCEYRTPASSLIPELTNALHVTAYCCLMKWQSLKEREAFNYEIDEKTGIPTIETYRALDITEDKRYTPHLEEFWKWANRIEGRKIDPTRDCLHFWVPKRKEVKAKPGIKVTWASEIFPESQKPSFIPISQLDSIYHLQIMYIYEDAENTTDESILQISVHEETQNKINNGKDTVRVQWKGERIDTGWCEEKWGQFHTLKEKFAIDYIDAYDQADLTFGVSKLLLERLGTMAVLKRMVKEIAKIVCIPA